MLSGSIAIRAVAENQPDVSIPKNRMTSELSIFTAQLREFISFQSVDPEVTDSADDSSLAAHSDAEFGGYALVLFTLQFKHNAPYRKICEARGVTPDVVTHWSQIPAAPAIAFKEMEMTCLLPEQRTTTFLSSGTTDQKHSRHFHNAESLSIYEASLLPWFAGHVLSRSLSAPHAIRFIMLTPSPTEARHSSLVHMFETVRHRLGASDSSFVGRLSPEGTWTLNFEAATTALEQSCEVGRPIVLLGTAFTFVHLLDHVVEHGRKFKLPAGSVVMETGGYKGRSRNLPKAELHTLIVDHLGVPRSHIVSEYGMSELSSQAYDTGMDSSRITSHESRPFHFPPWARAQIISPETGREVADGEPGLIRVFDLANIFSVMAIQTEDMAIRRGDGFELLGRAEHSEVRGCSLMSE